LKTSSAGLCDIIEKYDKRSSMKRWLSSWHIDFSDHDNDIFRLTQVHIGLMPNTEAECGSSPDTAEDYVCP